MKVHVRCVCIHTITNNTPLMLHSEILDLMSLAFPMGWMMASALLIIVYRRSKLFASTEETPIQA